MARVEVQSRKDGRRVLLVDGTMASAFRPGHPSAGPVWDALAAPLLALPPERRRRVLVLGLGGGSVARIVHAIAPAVRVVGVDLDAEVLAAARHHGELDALGVECVHGDALAFLRRDRTRYDMVVEDLFVGPVRTVRKPDWFLPSGLALARRRLTPGGLFVSNTIHEGPAMTREVDQLFPHRLVIAVRGYCNRIVIGSRRALPARTLRAAVAATPVFARTLPKLAFRAAL